MKIDPGAVGIVGAVLSKLREVHRLDKETSSKLIQGLAVVLRRKGFGVVLHTASAESVREQALELARKKYYGEARKRGISKKKRFTRASVAAALDGIPATVTGAGGVEEPAEYIVGWTAVPPSQMGDGHSFYPPCDAIDCASMHAKGQGTLLVRGKKDGNRRVHVAAVSHLLAAEGDLCVGSHMSAENLVLPAEAFNTDEYLTNFDGGKSLRKMSKRYKPKASNLRCSRHLLDECVKGSRPAKDSVEILKRLVMVPKGHVKVAEKLYAELPEDSPVRNVVKEELVPAFLPEVLRYHCEAYATCESLQLACILNVGI